MMFAANTDWGSDFACANVQRTGLLKSDLAHFRDLISRTTAALSMLSKLQQQTMRRMQCCAAAIDEQLDWFALYMRCIKVGRDPCGEPSAELKTLMQQDGVLPMSIKDDMFDGSPSAHTDTLAAATLDALRNTRNTRSIAVVVPFVLKQVASVLSMLESWRQMPPCTPTHDMDQQHALVLYFNKNIESHPGVIKAIEDWWYSDHSTRRCFDELKFLSAELSEQDDRMSKD